MAYISKTIAVSTSASSVEAIPSHVEGHKPYPIGYRLIPGSGGTLLLETSRTPGAGAGAVSPTWVAHPDGAVSTTTDIELVGPVTAVRFTATTANGTVEVCA